MLLWGNYKKITDGTVKEIDQLQIALQSIRLRNIDLNKLPEIMERLNHYAELMGKNVSDVFEQFARGAEMGSKRFQNTFGLLYDVKKAQEDYAESIGTTSKNLDEEEKRAINVKTAFEALMKQHVSTGTEAEKNLEVFAQMNVTLDKVKVTIGELIASPLGSFLGSVATEALMAVEGLKSVYLTLKMTLQQVEMNYAGAAQTGGELLSLGEKLIQQRKDIASLWGVISRTSKPGAIGAAPGGMPPHVVGTAELKEEDTAYAKLIEDAKKLNQVGALSQTQYAERLKMLEKQATDDQQRMDIGVAITENEKEQNEQAKKDFKEVEEILADQYKLNQLSTLEYVKRLQAIREMAPDLKTQLEIDEKIRKAWMDTEGFKDAEKILTSGFDTFLHKELEVTRQGKDAWDSAWIAMENTAIQAIEAVAQKLLISGILDLLSLIFDPEPTGGGLIAGIISNISGGGDGGSSNHASVSVHPIISNQGLAVQVQVGRQQRSGRVIS